MGMAGNRRFVGQRNLGRDEIGRSVREIQLDAKMLEHGEQIQFPKA